MSGLELVCSLPVAHGSARAEEFSKTVHFLSTADRRCLRLGYNIQNWNRHMLKYSAYNQYRERAHWSS